MISSGNALTAAREFAHRRELHALQSIRYRFSLWPFCEHRKSHAASGCLREGRNHDRGKDNASDPQCNDVIQSFEVLHRTLLAGHDTRIALSNLLDDGVGPNCASALPRRSGYGAIRATAMQIRHAQIHSTLVPADTPGAATAAGVLGCGEINTKV